MLSNASSSSHGDTMVSATQRWMSVRLDFLGALLTFAVAMMYVRFVMVIAVCVH